MRHQPSECLSRLGRVVIDGAVAPSVMCAAHHLCGTGSLVPRGSIFALLLALGVAGGRGAAAAIDKSEAVHWAFKPALRPQIPRVNHASWSRNPIDDFVLARLEAEKLAPSPEADRLTLLRRLSFDLTGLPPTPDEVREFVSARSPAAYDRLVDRLLNSPRYGERWARHWLDAVHYGESHGYDKDKPRPNAWPYRDYVIRSFNNDEPYSRFVQEQLAGDVLFPDTPDGVIALGFIAAGPWDYVGHVELPESKTDGLIARYNDRDDMVMNTMSTFLSLTVHCARCHDHKFDPISQEEYYGLQAVFAGVDRADRAFDADPQVSARRRQWALEKKKLEARQKEFDGAAAKVTDPEIQPKESAQATERLEEGRKSQVEARLDAGTKSEIVRVRDQLAALNADIAALPKPQMVYAAAAEFPPAGSFVPSSGARSVHLLQRGDVRRPGPLIGPAALKGLPGLTGALEIAHPGDEGSRRAALAKWLTDPVNLLTRRSLVNRVWQHHFGRGIVDTPNDFGAMGALPTHPELLDWLAYWFVEHGESLKALHRLIVTSATYRQSSQTNPQFARVDGDNRFLWRMNRQRLDAESFHDTLLLLGGRLDLTMGGPSAQQFSFKDDHSPVYDYSRFDVDTRAGSRRSIYRFIVRSVPDPFMEALDCPDANLLTPKRTVTVTALQALSTLNDAFVVRQCEHFAERVRQSSPDLSQQIELIYQLALDRAPGKTESKRLGSYAAKFGLANVCRLLINSNEFMFID